MGNPMRGYESEAESACADLGRLLLGTWSGRERLRDNSVFFKRNRKLTSRRTVANLQEAAPGDRKARALLGLALEWRIAAARQSEDRAVARIEGTEMLRTRSGFVPLTRFRAALAAEPDAERRREIWDHAGRLRAERLNAPLVVAREAERRALQSVGYRDGAEAFEAHSGVSLDALAESCSSFLSTSAGALEALEGELRAATGWPSDGPLLACDLGRLLALARGDEKTGGEADLAAVYARTLDGLGIDAAAQENVHLDLEPRDGKSERAFCMAIRIPAEIHLVLQPRGGAADLAALLHEIGHAQHRAHTDPGLSFCDRALGDVAISESYAFLIESLVGEPAWLKANLPAAPSVAPAATRYERLMLARRYAALLQHELELDRDWDRVPRETHRERYRELLSEATGAEYGPEGWIRDLDPGYYSARYLRGWMLAAHWRAALRERFGEAWFDRADAGEWLRALWRRGQELSAEQLLAAELGEELGFKRLDEELMPPAAA